MGTINYIFHASRGEAEQFLADPEADFPPGADFCDFIIRVEAWAELLGIYPDDAMSVERPVGEPRPEGPWLMMLPDELTAALANLTTDEIETVATRLSSTEDSQLYGYSREIAHEDVVNCVRLAAEAVEAKHALYVFMSL